MEYNCKYSKQQIIVFLIKFFIDIKILQFTVRMRQKKNRGPSFKKKYSWTSIGLFSVFKDV